MIDTKELRLGNIIQRDEAKGLYATEEIIVREIKENKIGVIREYGMAFTDCVLCSGIMLTEEWLSKFGFQKLMNGTVYRKKGFSDYIMIDCEKRPDGYQIYLKTVGSGFAIGLKQFHVHELQNLYFSLTGGEL